MVERSFLSNDDRTGIWFETVFFPGFIPTHNALVHDNQKSADHCPREHFTGACDNWHMAARPANHAPAAFDIVLFHKGLKKTGQAAKKQRFLQAVLAKVCPAKSADQKGKINDSDFIEFNDSDFYSARWKYPAQGCIGDLLCCAQHRNCYFYPHLSR